MEYSILLSLYKKEKPEFLEQCLASLHNQTIQPSETVIVFDGPISIDLENIVNRWKDLLKISIIRLEKNMGLGIALNAGLKECRYNIVARADTDDIYHPKRMEYQLNFLKENPEYVIVGTNILEFRENPSNSCRIRKTPETAKEIRDFIKSRNPFNHMSVSFKKDFIESIGGYQHHPYMEDYNLWIRALSRNPNMYNIQENLVYARIGQKNEMISRRKGVSYIKSEYILFKLIVKQKINSPFSSFFIFFGRAAIRLLPASTLSKIYQFARSKKE